MKSSWFQRYLLPGLAFKAVVIGGGYATGRELAEFFLQQGLAAAFRHPAGDDNLERRVRGDFLSGLRGFELDYRTFFRNLLGRFWVIFEAAYLLFIILILAVFGAAAAPSAPRCWLAAAGGTCCLIACISLVRALRQCVGGALVQMGFFFPVRCVRGIRGALVLAFGDRIVANFASAAPSDGGCSAD